MNKQKLFTDFDLTIIDSIQAYVDVYNELYINHPNFKPADAELVNQYNMKDQCPLVDNPLDIFHHPLFFKFAEFINNNTYKVLEELNNKYQLIVCSIGTPKNISYKARWMEDNLPFIQDYVLITNPNCHMNKSIINMDGAIFLDDIPFNLDSSNAKRKILFGKKFSWNSEWNGEWCENWSEVEGKLL